MILTALDAALGVDLVEVGRHHLADHAVSGSRSAVRHGVANADLIIDGTCGRNRLSGPNIAADQGKSGGPQCFATLLCPADPAAR